MFFMVPGNKVYLILVQFGDGTYHAGACPSMIAPLVPPPCWVLVVRGIHLAGGDLLDAFLEACCFLLDSGSDTHGSRQLECRL